jgi:spermidine/putrescine transport system permease protein
MTQKSFTRFLFPSLLFAAYLFIYIPIVVLIIFSFNDNPFTFHWQSLTTKWYSELFASAEVWSALENSLIVAGSAVTLSLVIGVLFVFYGVQNPRIVRSIFYGNLAAPEIVLAIGMLSLFSFFSIPVGMATLIAGHTVIGLGYVVPLVYEQYCELDRRFAEASLDLGATQMQTLRKVIIPMLMPSIIGSCLLVFIVSFDDFVFSFFCAGPGTQTLPLYIFSMIRTGASPLVSALSVVLLSVSSLFVVLFTSLRLKKGVMS